MNPWVPNQHGAWPMVAIPPLVGLFWCLKIWDAVSPVGPRATDVHGTAGMVLAFLAVTVAWVVGYLAFFAGGILMRARNATMRRRAVAPTAGLRRRRRPRGRYSRSILQPHLLWWAFVFLPLVGDRRLRDVAGDAPVPGVRRRHDGRVRVRRPGRRDDRPGRQ
jgi:hypothetical protein